MCSSCKKEGLVLPFSVVADDCAGEAEALCSACLFNPEGLRVDVPMAELSPERAPRRKALKRNRKVSQKQEVDVMEELGGRTQPGSGNQAGAKGDGRKKGELRVEMKFTSAGSYSVHLEDLWKIASEATHGELPLFVVDFKEPGTSKLVDRFVILNAVDFKELLNAARPNR